MRLTDAHKLFMVQRLAMFDTPSEVADAVKEEFGIVLSRQAVQVYDPTVGEKPGKKWCAVFDTTRAAFLESQASIPIAQRSVRLRHLDEMVHRAKRMKNLALAKELIVEAAKEVGDVYTNRRQLAHSGALTIEQLLAEGDE